MEETNVSRDNLVRLLNLGRRKRPRVNHTYSLIVRILQLLLPLLALAIVAVTVAWPRMDDTINAIPKEEILPGAMGKNELINARYESMNKNGQPYIVTAARATQEEKDMNIIFLESPVADFSTTPETLIKAQAQNGVYNQAAGTLNLQGNVILTRTGGYDFKSEKLDVDLRTGMAATDTAIIATGPDTRLEAKGMDADNMNGFIIFKGPAKLVLNGKGALKP